MSLEEDFEAASVRVKKLKGTPGPADLLELYSLYKQGTTGDVSGARPGMLDMKGRAKFDAWEKKRGLSKEDARSAYVTLVDALAKKYGE